MPAPSARYGRRVRSGSRPRFGIALGGGGRGWRDPFPPPDDRAPPARWSPAAAGLMASGLVVEPSPATPAMRQRSSLGLPLRGGGPVSPGHGDGHWPPPPRPP